MADLFFYACGSWVMMASPTAEIVKCVVSMTRFANATWAIDD